MGLTGEATAAGSFELDLNGPRDAGGQRQASPNVRVQPEQKPGGGSSGPTAPRYTAGPMCSLQTAARSRDLRD